MITLLRLLDLPEIGIELLLLGERGAVDAAEHFAIGIAAPIGAGDLHQLERAADLAGRRHVRPAAKVEPLSLLVDPDLLIGGDRIDELDLEQLASLGEHAPGFLARPDFLAEGFVARDDLAHLVLDRAEILGRERLAAERNRSKTRSRSPGPIVTWVPGHSVWTASASTCAASCRISSSARGSSRERNSIGGIALDRIGEIGELSVERHRNRALGERRRDRLGDVEAGDAAGIVPTRAVGKGHRDHQFAPVAHSLPTNAGKRVQTIVPAIVIPCRGDAKSPGKRENFFHRRAAAFIRCEGAGQQRLMCDAPAAAALACYADKS